MKNKLNQLRLFATNVTRTAKVRRRLVALAVVVVVLQLYFVRELIAAELLFGLGFAFLFFLVAVFYAVGAIGERAIGVTKVGAHAFADSAHRGFAKASSVLEVAAKRILVFAETRFETFAHSFHRGSSELALLGQRGVSAVQIAATALMEWSIREWTRMKPVLEAASKEFADLAESGSKALALSLRRGFHKIEELSKKPFRHPRSESAR
jgi:hypothetical protein